MAIKKTIEIDVNAKNAIGELDHLKKSFEDVYGEIQPLSGRTGELEDRLYELALAGQQNTKEFKDLSVEVAKAKKVIVDVDMAVDGMSQTMAQKVGGSLAGVTAGFSLGAGVMGAFGADAEELEATLLKVNSAMAMAQGVQGIKEAIPSFKAMGKSAATALSGIKTGIAATGIGVLLIAVGALAANWDKVSDALFKTDERQDALNDTIDDYKSGIAEATKKTNEVQVAFNLAKKGVISKEEALKKYNTSLGKSFGAATNLNDAEKLFSEKTEAYKKAAGERARANALMARAAELEADKVTASMENQVSTADVVSNSFTIMWDTVAGNEERVHKRVKKLQDKGVKEFEKNADKKLKIYNKEAETSMETAETLEKANDISSEAEQDLAADRASRWADQRARLIEEADARRQLAADIKAIQDQTTEEHLAELKTRDEAEKARKEEGAKLMEMPDIALPEEDVVVVAEELRGEALLAIKEKWRKKDEESNMDYTLRLMSQADEQLEHASTALNSLDELNNALTDAAVAKAGTNEAAAEAARKKGFERSKKIQLTMAIITGIQGVMAAFTAGSSMGPAGIVMGPLMAGIAAITAATNVAKISKMKYEGGGGGGASVGAAPSVPNPASFDVVGNSSTNQLADSLSAKPVQAFVVGSEVTTQQSLDRNKIATASM